MERHHRMMAVWAAAGVAAFLLARTDEPLVALVCGAVLLAALVAESYTYVTGG